MTLAPGRNDALLAWYRSEARDLPWRNAPDPYRVLVSEVMLQQTQAERVIPFFDRFLEAFPTLDDLAAAPLRRVLERWSGLGYNNRAKRLHEAARVIAARGWPDTVAGLEELPGVGPYTARALGAFAFSWPVVPVDTNLRRVLSRWRGVPLDGAALQAAADADSSADTAEWSQAVMDLGARICRPRDPACAVCPVFEWCAGPGTYVTPRRQTRFEGSARQVRGAVVRSLVAAPSDVTGLAAATGFPAPAVLDALSALSDDGLVTESGGRYRLPEA